VQPHAATNSSSARFADAVDCHGDDAYAPPPSLRSNDGRAEPRPALPHAPASRHDISCRRCLSPDNCAGTPPPPARSLPLCRQKQAQVRDRHVSEPNNDISSVFQVRQNLLPEGRRAFCYRRRPKMSQQPHAHGNLMMVPQEARHVQALRDGCRTRTRGLKSPGAEGAFIARIR